MSIETIATHINSYEEEAANVAIKSPEEELAEAIERRLHLHRELAAVTLALHELQARHDKLSAGILEMASRPKPSPKKARSKMTERKRVARQHEHRELMHTRSILMQEQIGLANMIHKQRTTQGQLITDTALANTTITRPHVDIDPEERRRIEQPLVNELYNNGEDPTDLANVPDELRSATSRYVSTAAS